MNFTWQRSAGRFATGSTVICNTVAIGETSRAIGNKSEPDAPLWIGSLRLPGLKYPPLELRYQTEDEAKAVVERCAKAWFKRIGVELP